MSARSLIVVFLALASGVSAAVLVRTFRVPAEAATDAETVPVLVAAMQIAPRTRISETLISMQQFPADSVPDNAIRPDARDSVVGQYSKVPFFPGDMLTAEKLGPSSSPAARLTPGKVAFSISTSGAEQSNANLLVPGDRVSLLFSAKNTNVMSRAITIMRSLLVVATNTRLSGDLQDEESQFEQINSITLEVSDEQAEVLAWAVRNGVLSVTLQSAAAVPESLPPDLDVDQIEAQLGLREPVPEPIPELPDDNDAQTVRVVVAARSIPPQTRLSSPLLKTVEWPVEHVPAAAVLAERSGEVLGMWTVLPFVEGEMLISAKIADRPGVALELLPDSVGFKMTSNVGLLFPGDRVNVIFTPRVSAAKHNQGSLTILSGKRVIATNDKPPQESVLGQSQFEAVNTILLEVTREQSELLSWAQQNGTLAVALLGERSDSTTAPREMTLAELRDVLGAESDEGPASPEPAPQAAPAAPEAVASILEMRGLGLGESRIRFAPRRGFSNPPGDVEPDVESAGEIQR